MNETVRFFAVVLLIELLSIWLAAKVQHAICQRCNKIGWIVPTLCLLVLIICCSLLLLLPANTFHYVVVLTDQTQYVFSSQTEIESFLESIPFDEIASITHPAAGWRWAQASPIFLCIVIGSIFSAVATWKIWRKQV